MSTQEDHVSQIRPTTQIRPSPWQVVPPLTLREYRTLLVSIKMWGVRVPIIIDEFGQIIDGYHRWRAASRLGRRDVPVTMLPGLTDEEKRQESRRLNLCCRTWQPGQKSWLVGQQLRETPNESSRSIARLLGVDHKLVIRVRRRLEESGEIPVVDVVETTTKDGHRQRQPVVKRRLIHFGDLAQANRAISQVPEFGGGPIPRSANDARSLNKAASKAKKERLEAEELAHYLSEPYSGELEVDTVREADVRDLDLPEGSVDLIFTDPQYHEDQLEVYEAIAMLAAGALKPGCLLFAYCGKQYLPQVIERLGRHLEYVWAMADVYETGDHVVEAVRVKEKYRTILVYKKPGETPKRILVPDAIRSPKQKENHEWQNADVAARTYIEAYTRPGDVVVDPCVGGGTVPAVCVELGRHFLAFDVDPKSVNLTQRRVEAVRTLMRATEAVTTAVEEDRADVMASPLAMGVSSL